MGGQMTLSPPANVKTGDYQILSSGIDTLYLTLDLVWDDDSLFKEFDRLKEESRSMGYEAEGLLKTLDGSKSLKFNMMPYGSSGGYTWILKSKDYLIKIGNFLTPCSRPGIKLEIRSEALWRMGAENAVMWILELIKGVGTSIIYIKVSRADLCLDMAVPSELWSPSIMDYVVTDARSERDYKQIHSCFEGVDLGKGKIRNRIYDKPKEIIQKSSKTWMYEIWGIENVPSDKRIIRTEFQLTREGIKELGIGAVPDLFEKDINVWRYLTESWLKFQDRPGTHHTQRTTLDWWIKVQDGYKGSQNAIPAIRTKAIKTDKERLFQQALGLLTSLQAAELEENSIEHNQQVRIEDCVSTFLKEFSKNRKYGEVLNDRIKRKRPRYYRAS